MLIFLIACFVSVVLTEIIIKRVNCRSIRRKLDKMAAKGRVPLVDYCKCNSFKKCAKCPYSAFNAIESCITEVKPND